MQPDRWRAHFADMLQAIEMISTYTSNISRDEFFANTMVFDAVIRQLSVLGEAANRVSPDVRDRYPDVPWTGMRRLRNFIVHQYDEINLQTIWDTIHKDLPPAYAQLKSVLNNE